MGKDHAVVADETGEWPLAISLSCAEWEELGQGFDLSNSQAMKRIGSAKQGARLAGG
jgi:hypothetical protein